MFITVQTVPPNLSLPSPINRIAIRVNSTDGVTISKNVLPGGRQLDPMNWPTMNG